MGDARTCIDELLEVSQKGMSFPYEVEKSGIKISVFKNVFSPFFFGDSEYFADNLFSIPGLNVKEKNILEIGTGTGLIALKFAFE